MTEASLWFAVLELGSLYSLIALSYLLVLLGADYFNFATGPYVMFSGLLMNWLVIEHGLSVAAAAIGGVGSTVLLSVLTESLIVRPIEARSRQDPLPMMIASVGLLFAITQLAGVMFGRHELRGALLLDVDSIELFGGNMQPSAIQSIAATLLVFACASVALSRSRMGRLFRAVGDNRAAASMIGLRVGAVRIAAFALAGLVAGIAGVLMAPKSGVGFQSGQEWTLSGFLALVIAGTGSVWAALVGGCLLAAAEVFVPYHFPSVHSSYVLLAVGALFFALRPEGLSVKRVRT